jgi:hypothetical protein
LRASPGLPFVLGWDAGKVYALFVKSPTRLFKENEAALRHVIDTFATVKAA